MALVKTLITVEKTVDIEFSEEQLEAIIVAHVKQGYPNYDTYEFGYDVRQGLLHGVSVTCKKKDVTAEES